MARCRTALGAEVDMTHETEERLVIEKDVAGVEGAPGAGLDVTVTGWLTELLAGRAQVVLAVVGCPGAGKSSLARELVQSASRLGVEAVWLPMDGFHLADTELARLGLSDRKGAIETFDGDGYLAALRRVRDRGATVYVPSFDRGVEQPIAGSIPVSPAVRLIVTEGNYLLDEGEPWRRVRDLVDEFWFCETDEALRYERLLCRHVSFGKEPEAARQWIEAVDEPNGLRVAAARSKADRYVWGGEEGTWVASGRSVAAAVNSASSDDEGEG